VTESVELGDGDLELLDVKLLLCSCDEDEEDDALSEYVAESDWLAVASCVNDGEIVLLEDHDCDGE
jgi:hypothetical protein